MGHSRLSKQRLTPEQKRELREALTEVQRYCEDDLRFVPSPANSLSLHDDGTGELRILSNAMFNVKEEQELASEVVELLERTLGRRVVDLEVAVKLFVYFRVQVDWSQPDAQAIPHWPGLKTIIPAFASPTRTVARFFSEVD